MLYLGVFIAAGALGLVFLIQPIIAHFAETLTLTDPSIIDEVQQRAYDPTADAGGFADALLMLARRYDRAGGAVRQDCRKLL
ncbi:MAG: hypothetical protein R3D46_04310 [Defluviimonas denitrificans]